VNQKVLEAESKPQGPLTLREISMRCKAVIRSVSSGGSVLATVAEVTARRCPALETSSRSSSRQREYFPIHRRENLTRCVKSGPRNEVSRCSDVWLEDGGKASRQNCKLEAAGPGVGPAMWRSGFVIMPTRRVTSPQGTVALPYGKLPTRIFHTHL
jgi:hypothetical protein